jgi:8-oxo-dGTP pyrophosphatase MutT (NUDIX family)
MMAGPVKPSDRAATEDIDRIRESHLNVGPHRPLSYLPINTVEAVLKMNIGNYVAEAMMRDAKVAIIPAPLTCIKSGAVYVFDEPSLTTVLSANAPLLRLQGWPTTNREFVSRLAAEWLEDSHPVMPVVRAAFGEFPTSIKGVLIHDAAVLLLLNERGEWDLPGGRPDPGEDHRTALKREVQEEAGLIVEVGAQIDEHLFEVLPGRFVRIVAYGCSLIGDRDVVLSHEHLETRWVPLAELGETIAGRPLPEGYLGTIRQAIDQPRSPSDRVV